MRIVSLIASSTEIVYALGKERELVGRSHECDYPAAVKELPVVTSPKFLVDGSSAAIHGRVMELVRHALSVYRVDAQLLAELKPDVVLTQTQCEVCAVSEREVLAAAGEWLTSSPTIVALHCDCLADLWRDILKVAEAISTREQGERLIQTLRGRMRMVGEKAMASRQTPTVVCIEWIDPLMAAGNWMPELVQMAGGRSLLGKAGVHSPWMSWQDLINADPEIIIITPCGFDIAKSQSEMHTLTNQPVWQKLRAVRHNQVVIADGNQFFNRPGPRLVESLEILAEVFHPQQFNFGHQGSGWIRA